MLRRTLARVLPLLIAAAAGLAYGQEPRRPPPAPPTAPVRDNGGFLDAYRAGARGQSRKRFQPFSTRPGKQAGIAWNLLFAIFGFPTETKAEWQGTLDFLELCRESVHALSRSRFVLLEGSDVFLNPERYGVKRIIDRPQRDPVFIAYDYQVSEGLTQEEVAVMFQQSLARLSGIGRSPWFGQFRDHMLLFASRET